MKRARLAPIIVWFSVLGLVAPVFAQAVSENADPFQRYITFYNELSVPIYPVIQAPVEALVADPDKGKDPNQQSTDQQASWAKDLCSNQDDANPACWVGLARATYLPDAPFNLLEYTIISQVRGAASPNGQNDPDGIPFLDFDVSYVDEVCLPVAMAVDGGVTAYMGSKLSPDEFNSRLTGFLTDDRTKWSELAAYTELNWPATIFSSLAPRIDKLPSGNTVVRLTRTPPATSTAYYRYTQPWDPNVPKACMSPAPYNQWCTALNLVGDCCPGPDGPLGCCDIDNFTIAKVSRRWTAQGRDPKDPDAVKGFSTPTNPTLDDMVARWTRWIDHAIDCTTPPTDTPVVDTDKVAFCTAFQQTIDFVYADFRAKDRASHGPCARLPENGAEHRQCIIAAIIGYHINPGFDAEKCKKPPFPASCAEEKQRNESVQALMRSLPYTGFGATARCSKCPSLDASECPPDLCVLPNSPYGDAKIWHYDKFLHGWAAYESVYNLNPFVRFVHHPSGLAAPGTYAFSIDDLYGNFGGPGTGLIVNVGGTSFLPNRNAYDPFTQYFVGWQFWDHAVVCGRRVSFKDKTVGYNYPISFWNDGKKVKSCEVALYGDAAETRYVKFLVHEVGRDRDDPALDQSPLYTITNAHTAVQHDVRGLSGVFATRGDRAPIPDDPYCARSSTADMVESGKCKASLSAHGDRIAYVGVNEDPRRCPSGADATCGRPLMNLNVPAFCGRGTPNVCGGIQPGPLPPIVEVPGQIRRGTATRVGVTTGTDGSVEVSGVFAVSEPFDLAAPGATVTILGGLRETRGAGELVMDHPLTLFADARNTAKTARFKTAPGETPAAEVTIGNRGRGQFTLIVKVHQATLDRPDGCPRPELGTKIRIADGRHRPVEVAMAHVWQCIERGATVHYLRAP